ncbi:MAG TPA: hypothetical protein VKV02_13205, partial [Acidobacteriaceae bacterium]|nr:hypothetical protein [Acidobacteriaceae bacterium]
SGPMPIRVAEMLRVVVIHVPSSTAASRLNVSESPEVDERGEPVVCYAAAAPATSDGFPRRARWCFSKATGLLASQDLPLDNHIVYSNYIEFQGKHEFTHVHVTSGSLAVLDIDIRYASLDPHTLDGSLPDTTMHRSATAGATPNPDELRKGTVEYRVNPPLPPGTSASDGKQPVQLQFYVSADNVVLDAVVEDAPTQAMAEAALQAAPKFTFTPQTIDGKPAANRFYYSVWFKPANSTSSANTADPQQASTESRDVNQAPASEPGGVYRSTHPPFTFRYPASFEAIPEAELEQDRRSRSGQPGNGPDRGEECNTLLFRAQRLRPGERSPEVVSMYHLHSFCVFGVLDGKALDSIAENAARSIKVQWAEGTLSRPKRYTVNGKTFAVVAADGLSNAAVPQGEHALVVITEIQGEVLGWSVVAAHEDLAEVLAACTVQTGGTEPIPILPAEVH